MHSMCKDFRSTKFHSRVGVYADDVGGNFYEQVYLNWDSLYSLGGRQFLGKKGTRKYSKPSKITFKS